MTNFKSKILFKEEQKFSTPWIFLVIFPVLAIVIYLAKFNEWDRGSIDISEKDDILGFAILGAFMFIMMTGLTILFYKMKMITQITPKGINIKYPPIINKEKFYSRVEINKYEIRKYNPKREYGGHGVKRGRRSRNSGKAYSVSGRIGLQLYLTNDQKILIGTQRKEAIKYAMEKMMIKEK